MSNESVANRQHTENIRIYERNLPSKPLQPYIDVRAVSTKYSYFPIVDPRKQNNVKLTQMPTFSPHSVFNPGNTQSPWSGFASSVNIESDLRNQFFALQKCSQSTYVPKSSSDLYQYAFNTKQVQQPHNLLFKNEHFSNFDPNPDNKIVGFSSFNNPTRVQIKNISN